eukprot:scaffold229292_cov21-Tisochrysis_lutea.AAC.1
MHPLYNGVHDAVASNALLRTHEAIGYMSNVLKHECALTCGSGSGELWSGHLTVIVGKIGIGYKSCQKHMQKAEAAKETSKDDNSSMPLFSSTKSFSLFLANNRQAGRCGQTAQGGS